MLDVEIKIRGETGTGKTTMANKLREFFMNELQPGQNAQVVVKTTQKPRLKGADKTPTSAWITEASFNV